MGELLWVSHQEWETTHPKDAIRRDESRQANAVDVVALKDGRRVPNSLGGGRGKVKDSDHGLGDGTNQTLPDPLEESASTTRLCALDRLERQTLQPTRKTGAERLSTGCESVEGVSRLVASEGHAASRLVLRIESRSRNS